MTSEPVYEKEHDNSWLKWLLLLLLLGLLLWALFEFSDNDNDVDVIDPNPDVVLDEDFDNDFDNDLDVLTPVVGDTLDNEMVTVTEVVSDRLFRVTANSLPSTGTLLYLDDSLDLFEAETDVVIRQGDTLMVSGEYVSELDEQTLEADESNRVEVEGIVFLVTDVDLDA